MLVKRSVDLNPLVERIIHGTAKTADDLAKLAVLAPGKTIADVNAVIDCTSGAGNFSYEHVIGAVAQRLFNAGVFAETFVQDDD